MAARPGEVFVGRAPQLEALGRVLDAARAGTGTPVLVAGEAGIGKTRIAAETARVAREAGFEVLLGRSIDLIGTQLPYQPFVEALPLFGDLWRADGSRVGSQRHVFEQALTLLTERGTATPVLLVLEDLHWADVSTLDLVVFLSHRLADVPLVLLATYRTGEASAPHMRRFAEAVRHAGSALTVDLGPLSREELAALLAAHDAGGLPAATVDAIARRSEGNPFFAEELLNAASGAEGLPERLRELLLQRTAGLDAGTQDLLRLESAVGGEVAYPLLLTLAWRPEHEVRDSLRAAVERGVLLADQAAGTFRFRHALLREAVYATIMPGEREELHGRIAQELTAGGAVGGDLELAPHWAAAGRAPEALATSVAAAREAEAVFGLPEALGHVERALALWEAVPNAAELAGLDLVDLCSWGADLAGSTGAGHRGVQLARRAIELVQPEAPRHAALLHVRLGERLYEIGRDTEALASLARAVELVPRQPDSPERAYALGSLAGGLMMAWRHDESEVIAREALALARQVGARDAEVRALTVLGIDAAYLGRLGVGLEYLGQAVGLAEGTGDHLGLERAYVNLTDVLFMAGRPGESARVAQTALEVVHGYGIDSALLEANRIEAWIATGNWDAADGASALALRSLTGIFPYTSLILRADVEVGRGDFDAAREHLRDALATLPEDRDHGIYDIYVAELALWERRWIDADRAARDALANATSRQAAHVHVWYCAKGLRAQAELAALARARREPDAVEAWLARAGSLLSAARRAASHASGVTPNAGAWLVLAEAEHERAHGTAQPERWANAARAWDALERAPLGSYCRWRQAEALVAAGAGRAEIVVPLREAHGVAKRLRARPLLHEIEQLARRARLDLTPPAPTGTGEQRDRESLGLTARELEVLDLVGRGCTNREIAAALVISVKTASVHVSHILAKLDAPNRHEAVAIAQRLAPPRP